MKDDNWIVIAAEDIGQYLVPSQVKALVQAGDAGGAQLEAVIEAIVEQVRLEVSNYAGNYVSDVRHTVPLALKAPVCHLVVEALQARHQNMALTADQVRNANNARAFIRRIGVGEVVLRREGTPRLGKGSVALLSCRERLATEVFLRGA